MDLRSAASSDFSSFNPGQLIQTVNELAALGKTEALDRVEQHLAGVDRSSDEQHGLFLVLRLLFEVPSDPGHHPYPRIGIPEALQPVYPKALPYFPLVVVSDIPLLLVTSFLLGGAAEPVESHLEHFRESGILRGQPLSPPTDLDIGQIVAGFSDAYRSAYDVEPQPGVVEMIREQLGRMSDPAASAGQPH